MIKCRDKIQSKTNSFLIVKSKSASECKTVICIHFLKNLDLWLDLPGRDQPWKNVSEDKTAPWYRFITITHLVIIFYDHNFRIETPSFIVSIFTHAIDRPIKIRMLKMLLQSQNAVKKIVVRTIIVDRCFVFCTLESFIQQCSIFSNVKHVYR